MSRTVLLGLLVGLVCVSAQEAWAGIIREHIGSNDPTTEGFTLSASGSYTVGPGSTPRPHWRITVPTGSASRAAYQATLSSTDFSDPSGWTFTALAQVNHAVDLNKAWLLVRDGQDSWGLLWITPPGSSTLDPGLYAHIDGNYDEAKKLMDFDPSDGFHYYQMIYNPAEPNQIKFYLDGVFIGTQSRSEAPDYTAQPMIFFGDGTGSKTTGSDSLWAWVRFETGQHIYVPEPGAGVLGGLAGLGFLAVGIASRWKHRHRLAVGKRTAG